MGVLGRDYDSVDLPDLSPYIESASSLVDELVTIAATWKTPPIVIPAARQELIERWLSAHFYTKSDPVYTSRSTAGASGSFVRGQKEPEPYKDAAINMDTSGCLNAVLNRLYASATWVGKVPSEQIPYDQRD